MRRERSEPVRRAVPAAGWAISPGLYKYILTRGGYGPRRGVPVGQRSPLVLEIGRAREETDLRGRQWRRLRSRVYYVTMTMAAGAHGRLEASFRIAGTAIKPVPETS